MRCCDKCKDRLNGNPDLGFTETCSFHGNCICHRLDKTIGAAVRRLGSENFVDARTPEERAKDHEIQKTVKMTTTTPPPEPVIVEPTPASEGWLKRFYKRFSTESLGGLARETVLVEFFRTEIERARNDPEYEAWRTGTLIGYTKKKIDEAYQKGYNLSEAEKEACYEKGVADERESVKKILEGMIQTGPTAKAYKITRENLDGVEVLLPETKGFNEGIRTALEAIEKP